MRIFLWRLFPSKSSWCYFIVRFGSDEVAWGTELQAESFAGFGSRWSIWNLPLNLFFQSHFCSEVDSASNVNEYPGSSLADKGHLQVLTVWNCCWHPQPSRALGASVGMYRNSFTFWLLPSYCNAPSLKQVYLQICCVRTLLLLIHTYMCLICFIMQCVNMIFVVLGLTELRDV